MKNRSYYVYIMTNKPKGTLYTGVTNDLEYRAYQHKKKSIKNSFTSRYNLDKLAYFEEYNDIDEAIAREKQLKAGSRQKKIDLIESMNKDWKNLSEDWYGNEED